MSDYPGYYGFFPRPQGEFPMNVPTRTYEARSMEFVIKDSVRREVEAVAKKMAEDREELERLKAEHERLRQERDILFEYAVKDMMLIYGPHWADREKSEAKIRELIAGKIQEKVSTSGVESVSTSENNSTP
jgi:hypothetical protein